MPVLVKKGGTASGAEESAASGAEDSTASGAEDSTAASEQTSKADEASTNGWTDEVAAGAAGAVETVKDVARQAAEKVRDAASAVTGDDAAEDSRQ